MKRTSEWVSPGHPDKVCDLISEYILDRYMERDPKTRYAVEVQMKDNNITLAGEVTSKCSFAQEQLKEFCQEAMRRIGYTREYAMRWGGMNAPNPERVDMAMLLTEQSSDIAQGVDRDGWGDQGIFFGYAEGTERNFYMPMDALLAREVGMALYEKAKTGAISGGIDIKTQATFDDSVGMLADFVVAIPVHEKNMRLMREIVIAEIKAACRRLNVDERVSVDDARHLVVNGTGAYVMHGMMGDCGTTGRKLAVDFYGGNCQIGGGSPWTKDPSKADLTLNAYARRLAVDWMNRCAEAETPAKSVVAALSCAIGQGNVLVSVRIDGKECFVSGEDIPPSKAIAALGFDHKSFFEIGMRGLPYAVQ